MSSTTISPIAAQQDNSLLALPSKIRDKILKHVLEDPITPSFESEPSIKQYQHYLAIALVNRQLHIETKKMMTELNNLVVVSSNSQHLLSAFGEHAVPFISDHHIGQLKNSVRVHVRFPLENKAVRSQCVMLTKDLEQLALTLRVLSLVLPHAPGIPANTTGEEYERISLAVRFEYRKEQGYDMTVEDQEKVLKLLAKANRVGKIKILGAKADSVHEVLPGHDEVFESDELDPDLFLLQKAAWFRKCRSNDGLDYIMCSRWLLNLARRAWNKKNYDLAAERFHRTVDFIGSIFEHNSYVFSPALEVNVEPKLDTTLFRAGYGMVRALIKMGDWDMAKHHIKIALSDLQERKWLPEDDIREAKRLRAKINKHFASIDAEKFTSTDAQPKP